MNRRDVLVGAAAIMALSGSRASGQTTSLPDIWDLSPIFPSDAAWNSEFQGLRAAIAEFGGPAGGLDGGDALRSAFDEAASLDRRLARLRLYARLSADQDLSVAANVGRVDRVAALAGEWAQARVFLTTEVHALGARRIERLIASNEALAAHAFTMRDILRRGPHTPSAETLDLFAGFAPVRAGPTAVYNILTGAEMPWRTVRLANGEEVRADIGTFLTLSHAPVRRDRQTVSDAMWETFAQFRNTLATNFNGVVQGRVFEARERGYASVLAMTLDRENVPAEVYSALISQARASLPVFHTYLRAKRRLLGVERLEHYDIAAPVAEIGTRYTIEAARMLMLDAVRPVLGDSYADELARLSAEPRVLARALPNKSAGAYADGTPDTGPYILLPFDGGFWATSTYAHEWAHGMHFALFGRAQPYQYAGSAYMVGEMTGLVHEMLLLDHAMAGARSDAERKALAAHGLDLARANFFTAVIDAEHEAALYAAAERGEPYNADAATAAYGALERIYLGADAGVVNVNPAYAYGWAFYPHYYESAFYNYQYPVAMAAAAHFVEQIQQNGAVARERYLNLLQSGESDYPVNLFARAGYDLTAPGAYAPLMRQLERLILALAS